MLKFLGIYFIFIGICKLAYALYIRYKGKLS
nr:MAG TPA: hypothetical protein [Caudoviricetes sp.]